jgi:dihydroxyacetone kinase-like predicted kinase
MPGRILDYGVSLGSLQDINIENLQEQSLRYAADSARQHGRAALNGSSGAGSSATAVAAPPAVSETLQRQVGEIGTVAVAAGNGWGKVFESLGVSRLVPGGQTMNPSTQDLLQAVEACPAAKVIILPNNGNIVMSARQVKDLTHKQVCVVPSDSLPQGASALLAFSPEADFETNCAAMEAALKHVVTAEVTQAVRSVQLDGVPVAEGDVIGLVNGRLVSAGPEMDAVVRETLVGMQAEQREILTIYYGADVTAAQAEELKQRITSLYSKLEVEVVEGGQPFYAYIISAE